MLSDENTFCVGGTDDGVFDTKLGPVGAAVYWETIRTQTVRRLRSKVGLLMTGSHWWSEPGWPGAKGFWQQQHQKNADLMHETQIVDAYGKILARRTYAEGAGVITAEITLGTAAPADTTHQ